MTGYNLVLSILKHLYERVSNFAELYTQLCRALKRRETVSVIIGGNLSTRFILGLIVAMDGTKLPLLVILKRITRMCR